MLDIIAFIKEYSYIGIFIIVCLESGIFFPLPGDSLLFTVGIFASKGFFNITFALVAIISAAILGGEIGYRVGAYLEFLMEHKYSKRFFHRDNVEKTKLFFQKHGQKTLVLGRFVPVVRTFAPILAGFLEMKKATFRTYNIIGGIVWGTGITMLGYIFSNTFPSLERHITLISIIIVIVSVFPFVFTYLKKKI